MATRARRSNPMWSYETVNLHRILIFEQIGNADDLCHEFFCIHRIHTSLVIGSSYLASAESIGQCTVDSVPFLNGPDIIRSSTDVYIARQYPLMTSNEKRKDVLTRWLARACFNNAEIKLETLLEERARWTELQQVQWKSTLQNRIIV